MWDEVKSWERPWERLPFKTFEAQIQVIKVLAEVFSQDEDDYKGGVLGVCREAIADSLVVVENLGIKIDRMAEWLSPEDFAKFYGESQPIANSPLQIEAVHLHSIKDTIKMTAGIKVMWQLISRLTRVEPMMQAFVDCGERHGLFDRRGVLSTAERAAGSSDCHWKQRVFCFVDALRMFETEETTDCWKEALRFRNEVMSEVQLFLLYEFRKTYEPKYTFKSDKRRLDVFRMRAENIQTRAENNRDHQLDMKLLRFTTLLSQVIETLHFVD